MTSMSQATVSSSGITTPATVENRELEMLIIAWWTLKNPKSQTSEKMKRIAGDIIILHICTKNTIIWGTVPEICSATEFFVILGHFLPCYQDMECDRQNCHFRPFFALLTHYWPRKLKFGKKVKNPWIYVLSFYTCVPKIKTIWCMVPEIWSAPDRIFCHLGPFFAPLPPTAGKMKISKMKKKAWRYHYFTEVYQNSWS